MNAIFITSGGIEWASSRMRAIWPAKVLNIHTTKHDADIEPGYGVYIWQKYADVRQIRALSGSKHIWDVCDPAWWWQPKECLEIVRAVDVVTASNKELANDFEDWSGIKPVIIPDALNLEHYPICRQHEQTKPVRMIWFGLSLNRAALFGVVPNTQRLYANGYEFEFTIFDDSPEPIEGCKMERWSLEQENEVIASHDIAILPPYPGPWGKVKSNNKQLTAWACGLPVTSGHDYEHLVDLIKSPGRRKYEAEIGYKTLMTTYTTEHMASRWKEVINDLLPVP